MSGNVNGEVCVYVEWVEYIYILIIQRVLCILLPAYFPYLPFSSSPSFPRSPVKSINKNPNPLRLNPKARIKEIMIHLHIPIARLEKSKFEAAAAEDGCEGEVEFAVG